MSLRDGKYVVVGGGVSKTGVVAKGGRETGYYSGGGGGGVGRSNLSRGYHHIELD